MSQDEKIIDVNKLNSIELVGTVDKANYLYSLGSLDTWINDDSARLMMESTIQMKEVGMNIDTAMSQIELFMKNLVKKFEETDAEIGKMLEINIKETKSTKKENNPYDASI